MGLQANLLDYLEGYTALTNEVGTRIYASVAPRSAGLPYLVFSTIDTVYDHHHGGVTALVQTRMQFDIYAATPDKAEEVAGIIRDRLDALQSTAVGDDSIYIEACRSQDEATGYINPIDGSEDGRHRRILDFLISWQEQ